MPRKLLERLREREAKLKAQIKDAENAQRKKEAALLRRKQQAAGLAVLDYAEERLEFKKELHMILDMHLKENRQRVLFDLPPLPDPKKSDKPNKDQNNQGE